MSYNDIDREDLALLEKFGENGLFTARVTELDDPPLTRAVHEEWARLLDVKLNPWRNVLRIFKLTSTGYYHRSVLRSQAKSEKS